MKIGKKKFVILILNLMAFGSLVGSVYSEFGLSTFIKILIPSSIIFGTTMALMLSKE